ncbi:MAG: putative metal-binding motif-containing protein, partial [Candidatus Thorarchaeota archaeon]|nr:putative metal-binding motif-containing protein [Candidatus Thorarchaeota archaeon]
DNDLDGYSISGGVCGVIDCNDSNDEIWQNLTGYIDSDLDTYGTGSSLIICSNLSLPVGYANNSDDCNDSNSSIHPGAAEICNNIDDNCNGTIDENLTQSCGLGVCAGNQTCNLGIWSNCSTQGDDAGTCAACNASGEAVYDDTQDSDCPATICSADGCGVGTCFPNIFGDYPINISNFCSAIYTCEINACTATCEADNDNDNYSVSCGDCNDTNASINPGAAEICNNIDDNCNGTIDEGFDNDGDNFTICSLPVPDCDDTNASIYPGAFEILNGVDDDCDSLTDENLCGNSICDAGENSNNCPSDCPLTPTRRSTGGGGSFLTACYENWNCTEWGTCLSNGTQYRECFDTNSCDEKYDEKIINRVYTTKRPPLYQNCTYSVLPNCNDRIQNQDETDVDCGGSICPRCRDGSKCLNDNDCFDKCDPERGICYTSVLPEIVAPTPA